MYLYTSPHLLQVRNQDLDPHLIYFPRNQTKKIDRHPLHALIYHLPISEAQVINHEYLVWIPSIIFTGSQISSISMMSLFRWLINNLELVRLVPCATDLMDIVQNSMLTTISHDANGIQRYQAMYKKGFITTPLIHPNPAIHVWQNTYVSWKYAHLKKNNGYPAREAFRESMLQRGKRTTWSHRSDATAVLEPNVHTWQNKLQVH